MSEQSAARAAPDKKVRLVYILAASHSGSTLLAMLLNSHRDVCTVGELKATSLGDPERYRCSCRALIRQCAFWNGISEDLDRQGYRFEVTDAVTDVRSIGSVWVRRVLRPLHRGRVLELVRDIVLAFSPVWRRQYPAIQSLSVAVMRAVLRRTGKQVIVDSSKVALRLKYLLRNRELDVRVIRLVRDGRGVALTYMDPSDFADSRDPSLRGGGMGGDRRGEMLDMAAAAHEWRRSNEEAESVLRYLGRERQFVVRYEDLCTAPESWLPRIFEFIGVDPAAYAQDFRKAEHHVVGNGMRLDSDAEIRLDERWRSALSIGDREVFDRVAGPLNRKLGYQ